MKERETDKRKSPVTAPVRNKETAMDFTNITAIIMGDKCKRGARSGGLLGAAEIFKMARYAAVEGRDIRWGGEKV